MATTEERLAHVEANVEQHSTAIMELKGLIAALGQKIDWRFDASEQRFDQRFETIDQRFETIDERFKGIDRRFEGIDWRFEGIDRRFDEIGSRFDEMGRRFDQTDRRLFWVISIQFGILLTIMAGMFQVVAAILRQ